MRTTTLVLSVMLILTVNAQAGYSARDVVINEIAWMGTSASVNDEWIELYNDTASDIVLDGWTLEAADGTPSIQLQGTILAHAYFLLERTDDQTVSDIEADQIYTGTLGNTGEDLVLKDPGGNVIDRVDCSSGWFAGDNGSKSSMERKHPDIDGSDADSWGTNDGTTRNGHDADNNPINGTPKAENSVYDSSLPVGLLYFRATEIAPTYVRLEWRTASETDVIGFLIERRTGLDTPFSVVSRLFQSRGSGSQGAIYQWMDTALPKIEAVEYRLKVQNSDGTVEILAMLKVKVQQKPETERVPKGFAIEGPYPNPFGPRLGTLQTRVGWSPGKATHVRLRVTDVLGREVVSVEPQQCTGWVWKGTDTEGNLVPTGVYLLWLENQEQTFVRKVLWLR